MSLSDSKISNLHSHVCRMSLERIRKKKNISRCPFKTEVTFHQSPLNLLPQTDRRGPEHTFLLGGLLEIKRAPGQLSKRLKRERQGDKKAVQSLFKGGCGTFFSSTQAIQVWALICWVNSSVKAAYWGAPRSQKASTLCTCREKHCNFLRKTSICWDFLWTVSQTSSLLVIQQNQFRNKYKPL